MATPTQRGFERLVVWQKAHEFVLRTYSMTRQFPNYEQFGLTSQLRRAAISIPANIAEGYAKRSKADKARYFNIAQGSLSECSYYLRLASDLSYADTEQQAALLDEVGRMLHSYRTKVAESANSHASNS